MLRNLRLYVVLAIVLKGVLATTHATDQAIEQVGKGLGQDLYIEQAHVAGSNTWKLSSYSFEVVCLEVAFAKNWWADFSNVSRDALDGPDARFKCSAKKQLTS